MARWPTLITVCALTSVGAMVVGLFWGLIKPMANAEKQKAR